MTYTDYTKYMEDQRIQMLVDLAVKRLIPLLDESREDRKELFDLLEAGGEGSVAKWFDAHAQCGELVHLVVSSLYVLLDDEDAASYIVGKAFVVLLRD